MNKDLNFKKNLNNVNTSLLIDFDILNCTITNNIPLSSDKQ